MSKMKNLSFRSIGQVARLLGISRSTLIYYDNKGVLRPSGRSEANYRLYSEKDIEKLKLVMLYRNAGLSLNEIKRLLKNKAGEGAVILSQRLDSLNKEITELRQQQQVIVRLIGRPELIKSSRIMNKQDWVELLRASGLDDDAMRRWHIEFERSMPEMHQDFLESLGIEKKEIKAIRQWSRQSSK